MTLQNPCDLGCKTAPDFATMPLAFTGVCFKRAWLLGNGAQGRDRTTDTAIFNRMLYQLSYLGGAVSERGRL